MGYFKGLVFYFDILGTKNMSFEETLRINTFFHNNLASLIPSNENGFVSAFSDCALIVIKVNQDELEIENIYKYLHGISHILTLFVSQDFLCRGGISYGDVYFENKNVVFGPAVNEAYLLEQNAKMPRLLISKELATKILTFEKESYEKDNLWSRVNELLIPGGILLKDDIDFRYYLNYLTAFVNSSFNFVQIDNYLFHFNDFYETVRKKSLNIINKEINNDIIAKHNWYLKYLDIVMDLICKEREKFQKEVNEALMLKNNFEHGQTAHNKR